jgi:hypothetical protein
MVRESRGANMHNVSGEKCQAGTEAWRISRPGADGKSSMEFAFMSGVL